jgi:beta-lactamase class A
MIDRHGYDDTASATCDRRSALRSMAVLALSACQWQSTARAAVATSNDDALRALEQAADGRLGVYILDTQTGRGFGHRMHERFAHCSSFKLSLAAMLLRMADEGRLDPNEVLRWTRADMLPVSPVTEEHLATGFSVQGLARATLITSDNTAANVLLRRFGGPQALTAFWRSIGDDVSRLDRYEPALNITPAGTTLDTTTPLAIARTVARLIHGDVLRETSRDTLRQWMAEVRTGSQRIRAGFPADWVSGDKTGTGIGPDRHTYVDLAYGAPAGRAPFVVAAFFEPNRRVEPMDPVALQVLADVGRVCARSLTPAP